VTKRVRGGSKGFTLVEMMVGVVIFLIGVVGFAGMTLMQAHGNRVAKGSDEAATLLQSAIEDFSNILWTSLGTDPTIPSINGLDGANVLVEGPLNRIGDSQGTGTGPYTYYRATVICSSSTIGVAPGSNPQYCNGNVLGSNRPPQLACSNLSPALSVREKMIRVLVAWTDRSGSCHYKTSNSLAFNW
jgi:prepilin-type N-terminal cleavage/methylation domain-containing protein